MRRFAGKVVLVTEGESGIGRATTLAFAREGATVVAAGRRAEPLAETAKLAGEASGRIDPMTVDVTDESAVARLMESIASRYGRLDVAFNNAGILG